MLLIPRLCSIDTFTDPFHCTFGLEAIVVKRSVASSLIDLFYMEVVHLHDSDGGYFVSSATM
jgi:hypothetical protein